LLKTKILKGDSLLPVVKNTIKLVLGHPQVTKTSNYGLEYQQISIGETYHHNHKIVFLDRIAEHAKMPPRRKLLVAQITKSISRKKARR